MTRTTTSTTNWRANVKFLKTGLIFVLVPFFLACESDEFLSLPANPDQRTLNILYKRIPVPFTVVRADSVNTSSTADEGKNLLAGRFQDDKLGEVAATGFLNFTVGPRATVGDTANYESLELELVYQRSYGTAREVSQTLEIYRLTETFDDIFYYSNRSLAIAASPLGTATVTTKLRGAADTLRFRLDDALGQEIFDLAQARDSTVLSGAQFRDFLPGLALVPDADNSFVGSFSPTGARIIMNFTDADGEAREHIFVFRRNFSQVVGDYAGTPLAELGTPGAEIVPADGNFYLQSGTGVTPIISMDSVIDFVSRQSSDTRSVLLNRVDLTIGLNEAKDTIDAPAALFAYWLTPDSVGRLVRTPVLDQQGRIAGYRGLGTDPPNDPFLAAPIAFADNQYRLPVTSYLNEVLRNDTLRQELYVRANNYESSVSQLVTGQDSVYLDVFYTILE